MKRLTDYFKRLYIRSEFFRLSFIDSMSQEDIQSMQVLSKLIPDQNYFPLTSYSMSPTMVVHILNDILLLKRVSIVEFGSGLSTYFIAKVLSLNELDATFVSIDHDSGWHEYLRTELEKEKIANKVTLVTSDLETISGIDSEQCLWYSTNALSKRIPEQIDLAIIDGPPISSGPLTRFHALPCIQNRLSQNFSIFLDDTFRGGEKRILHLWEKELHISPRNFRRYAVFSTESTISTIPPALSYDYKYENYVKNK